MINYKYDLDGFKARLVDLGLTPEQQEEVVALVVAGLPLQVETDDLSGSIDSAVRISTINNRQPISTTDVQIEFPGIPELNHMVTAVEFPKIDYSVREVFQLKLSVMPFKGLECNFGTS